MTAYRNPKSDPFLLNIKLSFSVITYSSFHPFFSDRLQLVYIITSGLKISCKKLYCDNMPLSLLNAFPMPELNPAITFHTQ